MSHTITSEDFYIKCPRNDFCLRLFYPDNICSELVEKAHLIESLGGVVLLTHNDVVITFYYNKEEHLSLPLDTVLQEMRYRFNFNLKNL